MGKITVKHYLNTNLKPYMVRGEKYFTVYMLITVNRKSTKIPSKEFGELHTETEFEELIISNELDYEAKTVENLIATQLEVCNGDFDTQLFSAYYNLLPNYYLNDSHCLEGIGDINTYDGKYSQSGWSLYDWFKPDVQENIIYELNNPREHVSPYVKKITKDINILNQAILIGFFEILSYISVSVAKYRDIKRRYDVYCSEASFHVESLIMPETEIEQ